jgi:hypothetical protein
MGTSAFVDVDAKNQFWAGSEVCHQSWFFCGLNGPYDKMRSIWFWSTAAAPVALRATLADWLRLLIAPTKAVMQIPDHGNGNGRFRES